MKIHTGIVAGMLAISALAVPATGKPLPPSLVAFDKVKDSVPHMDLEGLSLCKLLGHKERQFYALPTDKGEDTCDLSNVILAWHGWCDAGVRDNRGVHFSKSMLPYVTINEYHHKGKVIRVIRLNNYLKTNAVIRLNDEEAATHFFTNMPQELDIRGKDMPLFPKEYEGQLPPRR